MRKTAGRVRTSRGGAAVLIKISPDLSFEAIDELLEVLLRRQIAGVVATNTTTTRPETIDPELKRIYAEPGGLSGRPLRERSTAVIAHIFNQTGGALPVIGVGGIFNAADAWEKITAGATLLQVYSGLIYEGPGIAAEIVRGLLERMEAFGLRTLDQARGGDFSFS